jgi:hypothetical protein
VIWPPCHQSRQKLTRQQAVGMGEAGRVN